MITKTDKEMRLAPSHEQCGCKGGIKQKDERIKTKLDTIREENEEEEKENTHTHLTHTPDINDTHAHTHTQLDTHTREQRKETTEVQTQMVIAEKGRHIALHTTTHNTLHAFLDAVQTHTFSKPRMHSKR